jgi:NAD(P)-dependent dehydrogenase (short-subunit alcohol dehydrogenase family)
MTLSTTNHAFVTGGASGMGLAIADALAQHGVAITIADIDESRLAVVADARQGRFQGIVLDVRDRAGWSAAKAQAETAFGPVDILINNAGIGPDGSEFADLAPATFDRLMAVDLTGVFNGISAFAADMRARRSGTIVNNASLVGLVSGVPGLGAYTAAKAAVVAISEVLRMEMAPHGIGVSVICPGPVATDFANTTIREGGAVTRQAAAVERMPASEVAECVIDGIEKNELYILSHPDAISAADARANAIRNAFLRQSAR